jgi:hypothetical protein
VTDAQGYFTIVLITEQKYFVAQATFSTALLNIVAKHRTQL